MTVIGRGFVKSLPDQKTEQSFGKPTKASPAEPQIKEDPANVSDLIVNSRKSIEALKRNIQMKSGRDLFDFILKDIQQLKESLFDPRNISAIRSAMNSSSWINEKMKEWLGETGVADTLSQSVSNNITSEMGLALLDVADVIRPYPEVIEYLKQVKDGNFLNELIRFEGGKEVRNAINSYLGKYGVRCAGEIDITRPRWSEKPSAIIVTILSNIKNFKSGESNRRFEQGQQEALRKERELLDRLKQLPDGEQKANETKQMINLLRNFAGYREYPKYTIVSHLYIYKQALLKEAERLLEMNAIAKKDDIYYFTFEELCEVVSSDKVDYNIIHKRKAEYKLYQKLTPPRVITSEGEVVAGKYTQENIPADAIAGLPVSTGVAEGRARVILNMADADLQDGDILVTTFTDPSWTPLFLSIKALVTEVGGLMTHGAVIAREYGLPAVVGVENATRLIKDRQRIKVNGTNGYVEIL